MPSKKYNNTKRREKSANNNNEVIGVVLIIISAFILLCIVIRPILSIISAAVYGVTLGVFGLFSYPLFLSTLILGIALLQGRSANLRTLFKVGIACSVLCVMLILQLATTNGLLGEKFGAYLSDTYNMKLSAGGVIFGIIAYAVKKVVTVPVAYILFSIGLVCSIVFCFVLPIYSARKRERMGEPMPAPDPFVKGLASARQTMPVTDTTLFVDTIHPIQAERIDSNQFTPINQPASQPAPEKTIQSPTKQSTGVKFEPYQTPNSSEGLITDAHKILFGDRRNYAPPASTSAPKIDFAKAQNEYMAEYRLPPIVSEPSIKNTAPVKSTPINPNPAPAKPQKTVHKVSDIPGFSDIPLLPEKDISDQIVSDGPAIINGDDLSQKLAESLAPVAREPEKPAPTPDVFSTRKLELTSVQPIVAPKQEERPAILNGDYYGSPKKAEKAEQTEPTKPAFAASDSLYGITEKQAEPEPEPEQAPIISGSEYEKFILDKGARSDSRIISPESRFLEQIEEDRRKKQKAEEAERQAAQAQADYQEEVSDNYGYDEPQDYEQEDYDSQDGYESSFADNLSVDDSPIELIKEDLPEQPRNTSSSFNIIEEAVDLSEKSHLGDTDNTGYYNTVSYVPVENNDKPRSQIQIEDYSVKSPVAPAPKPKKKRHVKYNAPSLDMLITSESSAPENFNVACEERARILESTLQELKLPVKVTGITRGPAVTRFELEMPPGIPIKRIEQFSDDIAYYLASNGKVRIEAPIPGKRAVGIEVPNSEIDIVRLREIIESKEFQNSTSPLTLALGKDIAGSNIICNLEKMPHLLVAGATNSGKSVCLNSIIVSIMYKSSPEDVRIILIDPKRVEFNMYQGIPHLLGAEIINDAQQAVNALTWAKNEMDRRYILFGTNRARNLAEYNKSEAVKSGEEQKLPYIVLIVDELAELMMDNKKVIENKIMSIAQKARAAGIHLILATQRPSVDVITGTIKANLPSRIAFSVKSIVDSRTILDECGAETLLGRGDMLYSPVGMDDPKRVQGALVIDKEILAVTEYVRSNNEADFDEEFTAAITKTEDDTDSDSDSDGDDREFDPLMPEVVKCVIEAGGASASMIQRRFSVGYARASRMIDQMEQHKFVGPSEGSKPRAVYISREQYKEIFGIEI